MDDFATYGGIGGLIGLIGIAGKYLLEFIKEWRSGDRAEQSVDLANASQINLSALATNKDLREENARLVQRNKDLEAEAAVRDEKIRDLETRLQQIANELSALKQPHD